MKIRLYHAKVLTMEENREVFEGEIWTEGDRILAVLSKEEMEDLGLDTQKPVGKNGVVQRDGQTVCFAEEIDCGGNLLMPGFKNCHTHSAMTFLRSYADDLPLQNWLQEKIFPMEAKLQEGDIYAFTKIAILEYLTSGITAIGDMYLKPAETAKACMELGMRCSLVSGLNNFTSSIAETEAEYQSLNRISPLIKYRLGFHAEYTCEKALLQSLSELSHTLQAPVYMHLSETEKEVLACREKYGQSPVAFLDGLGLFDFGGGAYHCVHVSDADMDILKERGVHAVTNPSSNAKLASGMAPIAALMKKGITVSIGTDGAASNNCLDLFREMFLVSGLSKLRERDAAVTPAEEILKMAVCNGAQTLGFADGDLLREGKLADLILIDLKKPNMQPVHHIEKNLVYSGSKDNVLLTMIGGRVLYRNGKFSVGEPMEAIYDSCNAILRRMEMLK